MPGPLRRPTRASFVVAAAVLAACTGGNALDDAARAAIPAGDGTVVAPTESWTDPATGVAWQRLPLGAGGFVTGLVIQSSGAQYARTDVGGAYRYDAATSTWQQMLLASNLPADAPGSQSYAVESIAVSPSDPNVVLVAVGGDPNPDDGVAVTGTGRVLRSSDAGRTWQASTTALFINGNQEFRQRSERLAIDPADVNHVVFGTRRQGLWSSTDGGRTFAQVSLTSVPIGSSIEGMSDRPGVTFTAFDPATRGRVYAGVAGVGVLRSDDGGGTWRVAVAASDASEIPFEGVVRSGRLFVTSSRVGGNARIGAYDPANGAFATFDPGGNASAWTLAVDPTDERHLVATEDAARDGHLWRSIDGGVTWRALDLSVEAATIPWLGRTDLEDFMSVGRLVFDPVTPGRLWFAEGMGMWRTDDLVRRDGVAVDLDAVTWHLDSQGIEELVISDVVAPPGSQPITVAADRQGFLSPSLTHYPERTLVDGRFVGGTDLDYSGRNPTSLVWVGAEYQKYFADDRVARGAASNDGGRSWTELGNLRTQMFGGNVAVSATDPNNIVWLPSSFLSPFEYLDDGKGIYATTDGGRTWKRQTVDGKENFHRLMWWLGRQALVSDKVDGGVFYLQNDTADFYVSTDRGTTWKKAANRAPCREADDCHVYGQLVASPSLAGDIWSAAGNAGLYRSRDRGATAWQKIPGVDRVQAFGLGAPLAAGGPPAIYLYGRVDGDPVAGVWTSGDEGRTWRLLGRAPLDLAAPITTVRGDSSVPGRVYVGFGGNGVVFADTRKSG